jgi:hypothetical protein
MSRAAVLVPAQGTSLPTLPYIQKSGGVKSGSGRCSSERSEESGSLLSALRKPRSLTSFGMTNPKVTNAPRTPTITGLSAMFTFLLWCLLFVVCWPLALLALIAYPFVWLLLLPFRIVGVAVKGALEVIYLAITLPFRLLAAPFRL